MATIPGVLVEAAETWPERPALIDGEVRLTFQALLARVRSAAKGFLAVGLEPGDRFAVWAPNIADWIVAAIGGQMAGGVLVTLNTRFKGAEAADVLRRSKARFLFTVTGFLGTDYPALLDDHDLPELERIVILSGDPGAHAGFEDFIADGAGVADARVDARLAALREDDVADVIFTSGTTGAPKGAMTVHGQNVAVFRTLVDAIDLNAEDRYLIVNPFFHSFGYKAGWLACLIAGATIYPLATFDVDAIAQMVEAHRITALPGPPAIFQSLLAMPPARREKLKSLRIATTGAAAIPVDLVRHMKEELFFDEVFTAYGLTESTGVVSLCQKGDDFETIATTCGRAMEGVEIKLVDDSGARVGVGRRRGNLGARVQCHEGLPRRSRRDR